MNSETKFRYIELTMPGAGWKLENRGFVFEAGTMTLCVVSVVDSDRVIVRKYRPGAYGVQCEKCNRYYETTLDDSLADVEENLALTGYCSKNCQKENEVIQ